MPTVTSADGTTIAYERTGSGPALVLVDGAMCYRAAGPMRPLAALLQDAFTVYAYDRRGRGESTDTLPYAVAREIEDLQALIAQAGGEAYVYAISSGAALALRDRGGRRRRSRRLALYEPPFMAEIEDGTRTKEYTERLDELLDAGRRGDAVALFMTHVGVPAPVDRRHARQPGWALLEAIAPTLAYDDEILAGGARAARPGRRGHRAGAGARRRRQPAGAATGGEGDRRRARRPATHRTLDGQTHDVAPEALAPVLAEFFRAP